MAKKEEMKKMRQVSLLFLALGCGFAAAFGTSFQKGGEPVLSGIVVFFLSLVLLRIY